ncbi:MAG TPA: glycosyltransferase family 39 protein, partial [Candidatus Kapabacteria bacterium]
MARLILLSAHSVLLDEATVAIGARDIVYNHTPMWDAMSNAPFVWMIGRLLGMAGLASAFWLRFPGAMVGTASIVVLFFIARRLFEVRIALLSALLFAVHPFAVAFSRVLFADPFQLFFILLGILSFERYFEFESQKNSKRWIELIYLFVIWALAFTMKYNAIVPGAVWLFCGVISGRYKLLPTIIAFAVMGIGSFGTLLLWPYDAPVWFFAFMGKAGSYNFDAALNFYRSKLHLVLFPIVTEIIFPASILIAWLLWRKQVPERERAENRQCSKSILHLTFFLLIQTAVLIKLGRMFERYLLVMIPFACVLVLALGALTVGRVLRMNHNMWVFAFMEAKETELPRPKKSQMTWYVVVYVFWGIFGIGFVNGYEHYYHYLKNDVNFAGLAQTVRTSQRN